MNGPSLVLPLIGLIAAGALLTMQAPVNAALGRAAGDPLFAIMMNFFVGLVLMTVVVTLRGAWPVAGFISSPPMWAWLGGVFGACYITALILAVPVTGALTAGVAAILGQMVMALILDHFGALGLPMREVSWTRVAGAGFVLAGLYLSRL